MKIGSFPINQGRVFVIAEIGGNHEGDFERAKQMIREAAKAGADAVKFQIFQADRIVNARSKQSAYSGISHQAQAERFRKIEFSRKQYDELEKLSDACGVIFFASVFDPQSVEIYDDLIPAYKVASGDLTYYSLLRLMRKKKKPMILSTGASHLSEIKNTLRMVGKKNLIVLHCVCAYPAPYEDMNLQAIPFLKEKLKIPIGFSDHSIGIECAIAAVALGACVIEKHFTLDKSIPYGDHKLSVNPAELKQMVEGIRHIEKALGKKQRSVLPSEKKARRLVRRSLVAAQDLEPGHKIKSEDLIALRPLDGIPAEEELSIHRKKVAKLIKKGDVLQYRDLVRS